MALGSFDGFHPILVPFQDKNGQFTPFGTRNAPFQANRTPELCHINPNDMSNRGIYSKLITLFSILLTILFVYTSVSKLMHLDTFQLRVERMPYITSYAPLISWSVPFLELVIAGLLWFPRYRLLALYSSMVLLGIFTTYIIVVLTYSESIPCSCGGVISALGWKDHILLNSSFMVLAFLGILWSKKQFKIQTYQDTVQ